MGHLFWSNKTIEFLTRNKAEPQRLFLQPRAARMCGLGDLCCIIVADFWRERGDQHQRALHQFADAFLVGAYSLDAILSEGSRRVGHQLYGMHHAKSQHRLVDVELE